MTAELPHVWTVHSQLNLNRLMCLHSVQVLPGDLWCQNWKVKNLIRARKQEADLCNQVDLLKVLDCEARTNYSLCCLGN